MVFELRVLCLLAGVLLEPNLSILLFFFFLFPRWVLVNYLPGLSLNHSPPILSIPSSHQHLAWLLFFFLVRYWHLNSTSCLLSRRCTAWDTPLALYQPHFKCLVNVVSGYYFGQWRFRIFYHLQKFYWTLVLHIVLKWAFNVPNCSEFLLLGKYLKSNPVLRAG
jgi:hypothetical protein